MSKPTGLGLALLLSFCFHPLTLADEEEVPECGPRITLEQIDQVKRETKSRLSGNRDSIMQGITIDSARIEVVEFKRFIENDSNVSGPRIAVFKSLKALKGVHVPGDVYILFDFDKKPETKADQVSSESPEKGSRWIVFIENTIPIDSVFKICGGAKGRLKYSEKNFDDVDKWIEQTKGNIPYSWNYPYQLIERKDVTPINTIRESDISSINMEPKYKSSASLLKKLFDNSEMVFVGEYQNYEAQGEITPANPPLAVYKPVKLLKGKAQSGSLRVYYDLSTSSVDTVSGWKFSESMMPDKGSLWLLFISSDNQSDGVFRTYHGTHGRLPGDNWTMKLLWKVFQIQRQ